MPPVSSADGQIGDYEIARELGRGGMGVVVLARDTRLDRAVAIKALPDHLANDPDRLARFEREARMVASLNHPGIAAVYALEREGGRQYIVMEYVEGETLASRLERGPLPVNEAVALAGQIAGALAAAHAKGIVHRDVKPGNVMVTGAGAAKVLDFGLAQAPGSPPPDDTAAPLADAPAVAAPTVVAPAGTPSPTLPGVVMGTAGYMSPEQARGEPVDAASDVFSFGCVLFEMLTGVQPFGGKTSAAAIGATLHKDVDFDALPASTPGSVRDLLRRCLEKDPARRYASAAEVADALAAMARWARDEAIPELVDLCDQIHVLEEGRESWTAFELACEIDRVAPGDAIVDRLRPEFSLPISIVSDPPGARVFAAYYADPAGAEIDLGPAPLTAVPFPRGLSRIRLELPGHRPVHDLVWTITESFTNASDPDTRTFRYVLRRAGALPEEMEEVPPGAFPVFMPGLDHMAPEPTAAFLVDRHPVTNRAYKRFVDDGGYEREELWPGPFVTKDGEIPREEAMACFVDQVGQPGPAGWVMGEYPADEDDHPVTGVSWHEAAAYAAWADKSLPTLFHWSRVAFTNASGQIAPVANFAGRGTVPVGSTRSLNRFGAHDLAGNVREWIRNPITRPGVRFILGGGFNDPNYAFVDAYAQPAFDRSPANGFRCIRPHEPDPNEAHLARAIDIPYRDFRAAKPVPDEVFAYFRRQFHYDPAPLAAKTISEEALPPGRWQRIEIAAAYGGERMQVHLHLPERGPSPYQAVVLFPGSFSLHTRRFNPSELRRVDFLVKTGRAVILPVYKGTYERGSEISSDYPLETAAYKDHVVMWGKDLGRAIDLVESRDDLDADRIAYYGVSWGGALGAILPAIEPRIKANVLYVAGLNFQPTLPECDQVNYVTRVTQPTLMLNGELDFFFPVKDSQRPMFDLLGTPAEHKRQLIYERGHTVPKADMIRESLSWLDRYLGPVG
jgi:dienelactone hydrolase